ncbi:Homeodomain [Popillia japonica]|uniref:Homeodomain n=1 Tax=Popillia japonica TaxID=7064 RepID=A0AAW1JX43_POPJA
MPLQNCFSKLRQKILYTQQFLILFHIVTGKTRTKDKYRVVYTDHQRVELEKEFYYSRYITIRRKAELASNLGLSERQVKIWFQNRRAKERKQVKKRTEFVSVKEDPAATMQLQHQQQQQQQQHPQNLIHPPVVHGQQMSLSLQPTNTATNI